MTYLLLLWAPDFASKTVGALGPVALEPGTYLYIGSARRGLATRLARHRRAVKKRRWHIDYLLDGSTLILKEIWHGQGVGECELAARILELPDSRLPQRGFGASDCRCPAHFIYFTGDLSKLLHLLTHWGLRPDLAP